jgi:hypothetical protein
LNMMRSIAVRVTTPCCMAVAYDDENVPIVEINVAPQLVVSPS